MKNIILILIIFVSLMSCRSTKKFSISDNFQKIKSEKVEKENSFVATKIDTSKLSNMELTYTKIDFYDPERNSKENNDVIESDESDQKKEFVLIDKIDKHKSIGSIKSIEKVTIRKTKEDKAQSVSIAIEDKNKAETDSIENKTSSTNNEAPAPDPFRWRYIFYIILVLVGLFLYFKRIGIFQWIGSIISAIKNLLLK